MIIPNLALDPPALAFDRLPQPGESVRTKDPFGRLHISNAHISRAAVNEYFGREIPRWQELGLERERRYKLFRDPAELEAAVESFNNVPLMRRHVPHSASDHQADLVVGSTGTDAAFHYPFLDNSLVVWAGNDIDQIEDDLKKELSCSYAYKADMTPGVFEGQAYDGVMRNIIGNHVAIVTAGRAGPDVVIGDSKPPDDQPNNQETFQMTTAVLSRKALLVQGAAMGYLMPKLAADAKVDLGPVFRDVTADNFKASKAAIIVGIGEAVKGKIAASMDVTDLPKFLGAFDEMNPEEEPKAKDKAKDEETEEEKKAREAKEKAAEDAKIAADKAAADKAAKDKAAKDAENPFAKKDDDEKDKKAAEDQKVAMDTAIAAASKATEANIRASMKAAREAEAFVRPWVGELPAMDSAEEILRATAVALKVPDAATIHVSALKSLITLMPKPGQTNAGPRLAHDAGPRLADAEAEFRRLFPQSKATRLI